MKLFANVCVEGTRLLKFCRDNELKQFLRAPTHKDGHLLDLGLINIV